MNIDYTVGDVEDFELIPEGKYQSVIDFMESKMYGNESPYEGIEVRFIIEEDAFYGKRFIERYLIGHPNEIAQKIARNKLNKLAQEIGGLKKGDPFKEDCLLYKKVIISIRHEVSKKDGNIYARLIGHELVNSNNVSVPQVVSPSVSYETKNVAPETGLGLPIAAILNNIALNDEVPF